MNLFSVHIDALSLILGMILATILWWAVQAARPAIRQLRGGLDRRRQESRERSSSGTEDRYRRLALRQAQGMHLAAPLFSLEEIVEQPRLLAPPARIEPGMPAHAEDIVSQTVPYTPAWPELASFYHAPTLSLAEALSGGANVVVIGQPGSGKTVALAHLAVQIINKHPLAEPFHSYLPFVLHIADVDLPLKDPGEPLHSLIEIIAQRVSVLDVPRIPGFVKSAFDSGRALLMLDGLDELAPSSIREAAEFIRAILKTFPKTRIVTTGSPEHIDGLVGLGFIPLALAAWDEPIQRRLLARWSELWGRYVTVEAWAQTDIQWVDSLLLDAWLGVENLGLTPLEYTLKIWGAYAGDARGPRAQDAIEMHIKRLAPANIADQALQTLGMQANVNASAIFDSHMARKWVKAFDTLDETGGPSGARQKPEEAEEPSDEAEAQLESADPELEMTAELEPGPQNEDRKQKRNRMTAPRASLLAKLAETGLLTTHRSNRMRFVHPVFAGYLAGKGLAARGSRALLAKQPAWGGRTLAMRYFATQADPGSIYDSLVSADDPLLERGLLSAARWLRDAPRDHDWHEKVMARLADLVQSDMPLGLRAQGMAALVLSSDPAATALFRQFLQAKIGELRALAALGSGIVRDTKAVDTLISLLQDHEPMVRRAVSLALVSIGAHRGLLALASALQQSDEETRRTAAEALANNPVEGYETLREGAAASDILLRRATVFGLARIDEPWATEILEKMQTQDEQWVVRTVAVEFIEARQHPSPRIPRKLTTPADTPWLIEFAGRLGMGVTPGQPATDLFLLALKSEREDERRAALNYLRYTPTEGVVGALLNCIYGEDAGLREAAYYLVWEMSIAGAKIPLPQQFGLG